MKPRTRKTTRRSMKTTAKTIAEPVPAPSGIDPQFAPVIAAFAGITDVTHGGKGFGSQGLKVNGKLFAMPVRGRLVLKLPKARVEALVESGEGAYFDPGHGRLMRQWVVLDPARQDRIGLARTAYRFVRDGNA
jgi:hypothetical protein